MNNEPVKPGYIKLVQLKIELTRSQEYKALLAAMKKRKELLTTCRTIVSILEHSECSDA